MPEVLAQSVEPHPPKRFIELLLHPHDVSEGSSGGSFRLVLRHTFGPQPINFESNV